MTSATPRTTLAPSVAEATAITPVSVGPEARRPAQREHRAEQRRAAEGRELTRREPGLALQRRDEPDEHQAHHDRDHPADALQQKLIGDQRRRHAEHRDGAEHEHRGEPRDEQRRRPGDPQPRRADRDGARRGGVSPSTPTTAAR